MGCRLGEYLRPRDPVEMPFAPQVDRTADDCCRRAHSLVDLVGCQNLRLFFVTEDERRAVQVAHVDAAAAPTGEAYTLRIPGKRNGPLRSLPLLASRRDRMPW